MKLLKYYTPAELASHYFESLMCGDAQMAVVYESIEGCTDSLAAWSQIIGALQENNFLVFPDEVSIHHIQAHGIIELVGHFWNSILDSNLAESVINSAYEIVAQGGDDWGTWLSVKEMAETKYEEWENEVVRRKAVSSITEGDDCVDSASH